MQRRTQRLLIAAVPAVAGVLLEVIGQWSGGIELLVIALGTAIWAVVSTRKPSSAGNKAQP